MAKWIKKPRFNSICNLRDLYTYDLQKFDKGEILLQRKLPVWIQSASSEQLKLALQKYSHFVQLHRKKLNDLIMEEGIASEQLYNNLLQKAIAECDATYSSCTRQEIRDISLLSGIQVINHLKMAAYGTAASYAHALGLEKDAGTLHELCGKEKIIDNLLTQIAEHELQKRSLLTVLVSSTKVYEKNSSS